MDRRVKFFIAGLLFWSTTAWCDLMDEVPDSYCDPQYYNCSPESQRMTEEYWQAHSPSLAQEEILVSGSCYMVNSDMAPDHEHFAYLYLRKSANNIYEFFGEFMFFAESNPYLQLNLEQARQKHREKSPYFTAPGEASWHINMFEDPPWQYFLRQQNQGFLLIGFWGLNSSLTCQLH